MGVSFGPMFVPTKFAKAKNWVMLSGSWASFTDRLTIITVGRLFMVAERNAESSPVPTMAKGSPASKSHLMAYIKLSVSPTFFRL